MRTTLLFWLVLILSIVQSFSQSLSIRIEHKANFQYSSYYPSLFNMHTAKMWGSNLPSEYYTFTKVNPYPYLETMPKFGLGLDWKINDRYNFEIGYFLYEDISVGFGSILKLAELEDPETGIISTMYVGYNSVNCHPVNKIPIIISRNLGVPSLKNKINTSIAVSIGASVLHYFIEDDIYSEYSIHTTGPAFLYSAEERITTRQYGGSTAVNLLLGGALRLNYKDLEILTLKMYYEMGFRPFVQTEYTLIIDNHYYDNVFYNYGSSLNFVLSVPIRIFNFSPTRSHADFRLGT